MHLILIFLEIPDSEEIPKDISWSQNENYFLTTAIKPSSCDKRKGSLKYVVNVSCSNEWCEKNYSETIRNGDLSAKLLKVYPYSNYSIQLQTFRESGTIPSEIVREKYFVTKPGGN